MHERNANAARDYRSGVTSCANLNANETNGAMGIAAIEARVGERSWFANPTNTLRETTRKGIVPAPKSEH